MENYTYLIGLLGMVHVKMWEVPHFARGWRQGPLIFYGVVGAGGIW